MISTYQKWILEYVMNSLKDSHNSDKNFLGLLGLEDGVDRMSRNVGKELPFYAAQNSRVAQISFIRQRKPEI